MEPFIEIPPAGEPGDALLRIFAAERLTQCGDAIPHTEALS